MEQKKRHINDEIQHLAKTISTNQGFCQSRGDCNDCILHKQGKCDFVISAIQCRNAGYRLVDNERIVELPAKIGDPYYSIEWFCTQGGEYVEPTQVSLSSCESCCEDCDGKQRMVTHKFQSIQNILNVQRGLGTYYYLSEEDAKIAFLRSKIKETTAKTKVYGVGNCVKVYNSEGVEINEFWLLGQSLRAIFKDGTIIRIFKDADKIQTIVIEKEGSAYHELTTCDWSLDYLLQKGIEDVESDIFEIDAETVNVEFL